jgi:hypothetical protein
MKRPENIAALLKRIKQKSDVTGNLQASYGEILETI